MTRALPEEAIPGAVSQAATELLTRLRLLRSGWVCLLPLCDHLQVRLAFSPTAERSTIRIAGRICIVTLKWKGREDLRKEPEARFTLAHEIGHLVLFRIGVSRPQNEKEYWIQEELCDQFARDLLCPIDDFSNNRAKPTSPIEAMLASEALAKQYNVPLRAAFSKVSEWVPHFRFALVKREYAPMRREADNLKVTASSFENRKTLGTSLRGQDPVAQILARIRRPSDHRVLSWDEHAECLGRFKLGDQVSAIAAGRADGHTWLLCAQFHQESARDCHHSPALAQRTTILPADEGPLSSCP